VESRRADPESHLNQYILVSQLGSGGMGSVWKTWDGNLNRWVAIKFLNAPDEASIERFRREAQLAAGLRHPNIATVHEANSVHGMHFLVMDFIDGEPMSRTRLPLPKLLEVFIKVCRAIDYAHCSSVVHRDLKPANIMLSKDGEPFVTDFGLAKISNTDSSLSLAGGMLGTPAYMAPEQVRGKIQEVDAQTDVYGLGATLYSLATGVPPHEAPDLAGMVLQIVSDSPRPPRRVNPEIPESVESVILKALEKDKNRRYRSAGEFADALELCREHRPAARKWSRTLVWILPLLGLLAGVVAFVLVMRKTENSSPLSSSPAAPPPTPQELKVAEFRSLRQFQVHPDGVASIAFHPDGKTIAVAGFQRIKVLDLEGREIHSLAAHGGWIRHLQFAPNGEYLASGGMDRKAVLWAGHPWKSAQSLSCEAVWCVAFSPDGKLLMTGTDLKARLWEIAGARARFESPAPDQPVFAVAFDPDGKRVASGGQDQRIRLWNSATGALEKTLEGHAHFVRCLAFRPDGKQLASGSHDRTVALWDADQDKPVRVLTGHEDIVNAVAYSADGKTLASASADRTIRLWDTDTGREILILREHTKGVTTVAFQPDGRWLASGSEDGTVRLWGAN